MSRKKNKNNISDNEKKYRNFCIVLYSDNSVHLNAFKFFDTVFQKWAYIKHDKDVDLDGVLKKEHYHIVGCCPYPLKPQTIAHKLGGIENNLVFDCKNVDGYLRYLTHFDDTDKYPYNFSDIVCSDTMVFTLRKAYFGDRSKESSEEIYGILMNFFELNRFYPVSFTELCKYAKNNKILGYALSRSYALELLINEHNMKITEKKY